jgi:hypothetical protein
MPNLNFRAYGSYMDAKAVTPSDTVDLPDGPSRGIFVAIAGNVSFITGGGSSITLPLSAATFYDIEVVRVKATGTTATGITALY